MLQQKARIRALFGPVAQLAEAPTLKPNPTGIPDQLKTGIEALSGMSMDPVRVHYNSDEPAQLNALAYAQGTEIHLGPGQEQHLAHEAWHVVQQAQGRVRPTLQAMGVPINDDAEMEQEADVMGAKAMGATAVTQPRVHFSPHTAATTQRKCFPQQLAWEANYEDSNLDINTLFSDEHLKTGNVANTEDRGTFAHEHIQRRHGSWIPEYGIPPTLLYGGWHYADMVSNKKVYEIKPNGGIEDAVGQATTYVTKANQTSAGHVLATTTISRSDCLITRQLSIHDYFTLRNETDTVKLYLNYENSRPGEILYQWIITNESREQRRKRRATAKKEDKKEREKTEESAKQARGSASLLDMFSKQAVKPKTTSAPMKTDVPPEPSSLPILAPLGVGVVGGSGTEQQLHQPIPPSRFSLWSHTPEPEPTTSFMDYSRPEMILAVARGQVDLGEVMQWLQGQGYAQGELVAEAADILRAAYRT